MVSYLEYSDPDPRSPIECVWQMSGCGGVQRIVTDARPEIVFNLAAGFHQRDGGEWRLQPPCVFAGQITGPLFIRPAGADVHTVGIRLKSWAGGWALQDDAARATDHVVDGAAVSRAWCELLRRLAETPAAQRAAVARAAVLSRLSAGQPPDLRVITAVECAVSCRGQATVDALADQSGLSARQLDRLFYAHVGVGPKMFLRMVRFRSVFQRLNSGGTGQWAAIAAAAGYTDQSHLIRDFRQFAGCPPGASLATDSDLALHFTAAA